MTDNPRETTLFKQLVVSGMPEAQALETVRNLDRMLGSRADLNRDFNATLREQARGNRGHTQELTHAQIMNAGKERT